MALIAQDKARRWPHRKPPLFLKTKIHPASRVLPTAGNDGKARLTHADACYLKPILDIKIKALASSSCHIANIVSISFGGSRAWLMLTRSLERDGDAAHYLSRRDQQIMACFRGGEASVAFLLHLLTSTASSCNCSDVGPTYLSLE